MLGWIRNILEVKCSLKRGFIVKPPSDLVALWWHRSRLGVIVCLLRVSLAFLFRLFWTSRSLLGFWGKRFAGKVSLHLFTFSFKLVGVLRTWCCLLDRCPSAFDCFAKLNQQINEDALSDCNRWNFSNSQQVDLSIIFVGVFERIVNKVEQSKKANLRHKDGQNVQPHLTFVLRKIVVCFEWVVQSADGVNEKQASNHWKSNWSVTCCNWFLSSVVKVWVLSCELNNQKVLVIWECANQNCVEDDASPLDRVIALIWNTGRILFSFAQLARHFNWDGPLLETVQPADKSVVEVKEHCSNRCTNRNKFRVLLQVSLAVSHIGEYREQKHTKLVTKTDQNQNLHPFEPASTSDEY